jgi:hypothetical protein
MALRGFGYQTLTGLPTPLFGWQIIAAFRPSPDFNTGRLDPGSQSSSSLVPLGANTGYFRQGDHVLIGASNTFLPVNQVPPLPPDGGTVQQVNLSASNILVTGLMRNHSASEWCILALPCAQINILNGSAPTLYLGEDSTVGAASLTLIETAGPSGQITIGNPAFANLIESQKLWVEGASASNTILPYLLTV